MQHSHREGLNGAWRSAPDSPSAVRCRRQSLMFKRLQRGGVAVEIALVIPVLLVIVIGFIEFSRAVWALNTLEYAVQEGLRFAIVRSSEHRTADEEATLETAVTGEVENSLIGIALSDVTVDVDIPNSKPGSTVTVTATYQFNFLAPLLPSGAINLVNLRTTSQMTFGP